MPMESAAMSPINPVNGRYVDDQAAPDERTYATFQHLVGLLSLLDATVLGLIGAIVMWRIKARQSPFLDDHGREAVNFQLSLLLYLIVGSVIFGIITLGFGAMLWIGVIWIVRLIGGVLGAMAASRGEYFRYPVCIRFLKEPVAPAPGGDMAA